MTKKDFIALADAIIWHNKDKILVFGNNAVRMLFNDEQIDTLCQFCRTQNSAFNETRFRAYIAGECGPNGGKIK